MITYILRYLFLFLTGAVIGWCIEVVYRRYLGKARRWINPGFLSGPYLPIYGIGSILLYVVSDLNIQLIFKIIFFMVMTTCIEYLTGLFFLKKYRVRLWDYTDRWANIQGIICPLYTVFWTGLSLIFYFILYPYFYTKIEFIYEHLELSLFIGMFYGVLIVDVVHSFNLVHRLKMMTSVLEETMETIEGHRLVVRFELLKDEAYERLIELKGKAPHLRIPLKFNNDEMLREGLKEHFQRQRIKAAALKFRQKLDKD